MDTFKIFLLFSCSFSLILGINSQQVARVPSAEGGSQAVSSQISLSNLLCMDWEGTTIKQGVQYIPVLTEPCISCICLRGAPTSCSFATCQSPKFRCGKWQWLDGNCCKYNCTEAIEHPKEDEWIAQFAAARTRVPLSTLVVGSNEPVTGRRTYVDRERRGSFIVNRSQAITADGQIIMWRLYAKYRRTVKLQVWRPKDALSLTLVGENVFHPASRGMQEYEPQEKDRILVRKGDVIGFAFNHNSPVAFATFPCNTTTKTLYMKRGTSKVEITYRFAPKITNWHPCRTYSLSATVLPLTANRLNHKTFRSKAMASRPWRAPRTGRLPDERSGIRLPGKSRPGGRKTEMVLASQDRKEQKRLSHLQQSSKLQAIRLSSLRSLQEAEDTIEPGTLAFVEDRDSLYIRVSTGWRKVQLVGQSE